MLVTRGWGRIGGMVGGGEKRYEESAQRESG